LAVIIACAQAAGNQRTERTLAALYDRAYYDLYTGLEDIQVKLDKLRLLPNGGASSELAADVWRQSYAVSLNLTTLPISPEYATVLMRYANQLGAYCMAIARQETITEQNRTDLAASWRRLRRIMRQFVGAAKRRCAGRTVLEHIPGRAWRPSDGRAGGPGRGLSDPSV
jgi:hypothetical protein